MPAERAVRRWGGTWATVGLTVASLLRLRQQRPELS